MSSNSLILLLTALRTFHLVITVCEKNMRTIGVQINNSIFEAYDKPDKEHKTLNKILDNNKESLDKKTTEHPRIFGENQTLQQQVNFLCEHEETQTKLKEIEQY